MARRASLMRHIALAAMALVLSGCFQKKEDVDVGSVLISNCQELLSLTVADPMKLQINNSRHLVEPIVNKDWSVDYLEKFYNKKLTPETDKSLSEAYDAGLIPEIHIVTLDYTNNSAGIPKRDKTDCHYYRARHKSSNIDGGFIALNAFLVGHNYFTNVEQLSDFWYKNNAISLKTMSKDGTIILEEK